MKRSAEEVQCLPRDLGFEVSGLGEKPSYSESDYSPSPHVKTTAKSPYSRLFNSLFGKGSERVKEQDVEIEVLHDGLYDKVSVGETPTTSILTKGGPAAPHEGQKKRKGLWWFGAQSPNSAVLAPMCKYEHKPRHKPLRRRHQPSYNFQRKSVNLSLVSTVTMEEFETTFLKEDEEQMVDVNEPFEYAVNDDAGAGACFEVTHRENTDEM